MHTFGKQTHTLCFMDIKAHAHRHTHHSTFKNFPSFLLLSLSFKHIHTNTHSSNSPWVQPQCIKANYSIHSLHWEGQLRPLAHDSQDRPQPSCCVCTEGFVCTVSTYCKCAELVCLCVCVSACVLFAFYIWMCLCCVVCGWEAPYFRPKASQFGFDLSQASYGFNWLGNNYMLGEKMRDRVVKEAGEYVKRDRGKLHPSQIFFCYDQQRNN